eukprot:COSAG02_NODE_1578_length_11853_cov_3.734048_15_plen_94_part_00
MPPLAPMRFVLLATTAGSLSLLEGPACVAADWLVHPPPTLATATLNVCTRVLTCQQFTSNAICSRMHRSWYRGSKYPHRLTTGASLYRKKAVS